MASFEGGYDLDFVGEVLEEFSCCVCHLTLKNQYRSKIADIGCVQSNERSSRENVFLKSELKNIFYITV